MKIDKKEIASFISYDASGGETCPHCKEVLKPIFYWFDHKSSSSHNIAASTGLEGAALTHLSDDLCEAMSGWICPDGVPSKDAKKIAEWLQEWGA